VCLSKAISRFGVAGETSLTRSRWHCSTRSGVMSRSFAGPKNACRLPDVCKSRFALLLRSEWLSCGEPKSLQVLEGLLIFHTDFVDQLCVDNNSLF
jgi:hypothetical protein